MSHERPQSISGRLTTHHADKELQSLLLSAALEISDKVSQSIGFRFQEVVRARGLAIPRREYEKFCPSCGTPSTKNDYARIIKLRNRTLREGHKASRTIALKKVGLLQKCNACQGIRMRCFNITRLAFEAAKQDGLTLRSRRDKGDNREAVTCVRTPSHSARVSGAAVKIGEITTASHVSLFEKSHPGLVPSSTTDTERLDRVGVSYQQPTIMQAVQSDEALLQVGAPEISCSPGTPLSRMLVESSLQQPSDSPKAALALPKEWDPVRVDSVKEETVAATKCGVGLSAPTPENVASLHMGGVKAWDYEAAGGMVREEGSSVAAYVATSLIGGSEWARQAHKVGLHKCVVSPDGHDKVKNGGSAMQDPVFEFQGCQGVNTNNHIHCDGGFLSSHCEPLVSSSSPSSHTQEGHPHSPLAESCPSIQIGSSPGFRLEGATRRKPLHQEAAHVNDANQNKTRIPHPVQEGPRNDSGMTVSGAVTELPVPTEDFEATANVVVNRGVQLSSASARRGKSGKDQADVGDLLGRQFCSFGHALRSNTSRVDPLECRGTAPAQASISKAPLFERAMDLGVESDATSVTKGACVLDTPTRTASGTGREADAKPSRLSRSSIYASHMRQQHSRSGRTVPSRTPGSAAGCKRMVKGGVPAKGYRWYKIGRTWRVA